MSRATSINERADSVEQISEVLSHMGEALSKMPNATEAIKEALPWAFRVGDALSEALPAVKFLAAILKRATKQYDPHELGALACAAAYQQAMAQAFTVVGRLSSPKRAYETLKPGLEKLNPEEKLDFARFSFARALQHSFTQNADRLLMYFAENVGYSEAERRKLQNEVHIRFVTHLKTILSHGELQEKFLPFRTLMDIGGSDEFLAYEALYQHADYQRRQYEELPVLDIEPFALQHVYIPTECGVLTWKDIDEKPVDPFSEPSGGRHSLLNTVLQLFGDPQFNDAIVLQGPAGAGKSSFTLRLCAELIRQGLKPIRIRLRDMHFDRALEVDMGRALRLGPEGSEAAKKKPEDIFLKMRILNEQLHFGGARICPYVWILDGWDEITLSASEEFSNRVAKLLENVRSELLGRDIPVRVLLTGRPSESVMRSHFFRANTKLLTLKAMSPDALKRYVNSVREALLNKPVAVNEEAGWSLPDSNAFEGVFERYEQDFAKLQAPKKEGRPEYDDSTALDVLGLPLLAHLSLRLMGGQEEQSIGLFNQPTQLYRKLIDLTCEKSGQPKEYDLDPRGRARISGSALRSLLRRTAAAMSVLGQESISYEELNLRLDDGEPLDEQVERAGKEHRLTHLMISFYFKGGHKELGCEFLHKSFREYLFAEEIIETLKRYGREQRGKTLPERQNREADFEPSDPRYKLSLELSKLLAPKWIREEVNGHLGSLTYWEIERRTQGEQCYTEALDIEGWIAIRDALADLWGAWADGVHLKPQPQWSKQKIANIDEPAKIHEMIKEAWPFDIKPHQAPPVPNPMGLDAKLGDGLFRLCAIIHGRVADKQGWDANKIWESKRLYELWQGISRPGEQARRYQSRIRNTRGDWIVFSPSGRLSEHFAHSMARINAWASRPSGPFPLGVSLYGTDLRGVSLQVPIASHPPRGHLDLKYCNLAEANMRGSSLHSAIAFQLYAPDLQAEGADFEGAHLSASDLRRAKMSGARLKEADIGNVILSDADLQRADLDSAFLIITKLERADLRFSKADQARFRHANLDGAHFEHASLKGADFELSSMRNVRLSDQQKKEAINIPPPTPPSPPPDAGKAAKDTKP